MQNDTVAPASLRLLGPYELSKVLGRGGMGTVYLGIERASGREVAVKVLAPSFASEEGFRARFESEIQSLEKLRHPNIVTLFGYGEQEGNLFYAMELVRGSSLHDELAAGRRFPWREVVHLGIEICAALRHAHDCGVIHRDIKPANLLLGENEQLKLTDFGIAKLFGQASFTMAGGVLGTADYMAPEQARGLPVTPRTDLYSAGCVLYALLVGRPPFQGSSVATVIHKLQYDAPIPVGRIAPQVPEALEDLIERLLSKEPQDRVPTALALAKQLESIERRMTLKDARLTADDGTISETERGPLPPDVPLAEKSTHEHETLDLAPQPPSREAGDHEAPTLSASSELVSRDSPRSARTFVSVEERSQVKEDRRNTWTGWILVWLLIGVFVLISGWTISRLLAPPDATTLYTRIEKAAEQGEGALLAERASVNMFLQQHPRDERVKQVREWQSQINLLRLQASIERNLRRYTGKREMSPVQAAMGNAIRIQRAEPEKALRIFQGLLLAYDTDEKLNDRDRHCLELARRKIAEFERGYATTRERELTRLRQRYQEAIAMEPAEAISVLRGLVMIHESDPWAEEILDQIRATLEELEAAQNSSHSSNDT